MRNEKGWVVTRDLIKKYALELFKDGEYDGKTFTASDGWVTGFMHRRGLVQRQKTHQVKWRIIKFITDRLVQHLYFSPNAYRRI